MLSQIGRLKRMKVYRQTRRLAGVMPRRELIQPMDWLATEPMQPIEPMEQIRQMQQMVNLLGFFRIFRELRLLEIDQLYLPATVTELRFQALQALSIDSINVVGERLMVNNEKPLRIVAPNLKAVYLGEWILSAFSGLSASGSFPFDY